MCVCGEREREREREERGGFRRGRGMAPSSVPNEGTGQTDVLVKRMYWSNGGAAAVAYHPYRSRQAMAAAHRLCLRWLAIALLSVAIALHRINISIS